MERRKESALVAREKRLAAFHHIRELHSEHKLVVDDGAKLLGDMHKYLKDIGFDYEHAKDVERLTTAMSNSSCSD